MSEKSQVEKSRIDNNQGVNKIILKKKKNQGLTLWKDYTPQNKLMNLAVIWEEKSVTY